MFYGNWETPSQGAPRLLTGYELGVRYFFTMRPITLIDPLPSTPWPQTVRAARSILHFLAVAVFLLSVVGCAAIDPNHVLTRRLGNEAPADGAALDPNTRQQAFDFVWNRINEAYVDPKFNGVNWQQVGEEHQAKVLSAPNDDIFWKNLDAMVAELGDAHTRVLSSQQYAYDKKKQSNTVGLNLAQLNGEIIVMAVAKGSAAEKADIVKGNKLVTIDGTPATEWWRLQSLKARKNSTERARQKTVRRILNSGDPESPSDTLVLGWERNDGTQVQTTLTRTVLPRKDSLSAQFLPNGYGYMRLTGFDLKLLFQVLPTFNKIKDTPALVIDLRGNGGGALKLSTSMMEYLVQGKVPLGKKVTRSGRPPSLFMGLLPMGKMELELTGVKAPYLAPVAVLVDADSASASEFFASSLQGIGRAQVVGETTCGCLLGYMGYATVPGGGALAYSELDFAPLHGKRVEGAGVEPDHRVTVTRQDLMDGKDRALERAIETLQASLQPAGTP